VVLRGSDANGSTAQPYVMMQATESLGHSHPHAGSISAYCAGGSPRREFRCEVCGAVQQRPPEFEPRTEWRCTTKPGKLYIHLFTWPGAKFELTGVTARVTAELHAAVNVIADEFEFQPQLEIAVVLRRTEIFVACHLRLEGAADNCPVFNTEHLLVPFPTGEGLAIEKRFERIIGDNRWDKPDTNTEHQESHGSALNVNAMVNGGIPILWHGDLTSVP
jgi:hypothetical protein